MYSLGTFVYRKLKPELLFGYKLIPYREHQIRIAEIEKAILDLLYLTPSLNSPEDIHEMRFNIDTLNELFNEKTFIRYLKAIQSQALYNRSKIFLEHLHAHH